MNETATNPIVTQPQVIEIPGNGAPQDAQATPTKARKQRSDVGKPRGPRVAAPTNLAGDAAAGAPAAAPRTRKRKPAVSPERTRDVVEGNMAECRARIDAERATYARLAHELADIQCREVGAR